MITYKGKEYATILDAAKAHNQTSNFIERNLDKMKDDEFEVAVKKVKKNK